MTIELVQHLDVHAFLERAGSWLAAREAEHNLVLSITATLARGDHPWEEPIFLATVEDGGEVVGCSWRTPPHKAGLTRMPHGGGALVADAMAGLYESLPAVLAEEGVAAEFADRWGSLRDVRSRPGMRMRIHELTEVTPLAGTPSGSLRAAGPDDRELVRRWWTAFCEEAGIPPAESDPGSADRKIERGDLWLWDDGGAVCLVGISGYSPTGVRIGPVYTPPEHRGRGYGTAATAAVTRRKLDEGRRMCFLYTDLANPTSNSIYAAIGYRPVCDVADLHFEERP